MTLFEPLIVTAALSAAAAATTIWLVPTLGWWTVPVLGLSAPIGLLAILALSHHLDPPVGWQGKNAPPEAGPHGH